MSFAQYTSSPAAILFVRFSQVEKVHVLRLPLLAGVLPRYPFVPLNRRLPARPWRSKEHDQATSETSETSGEGPWSETEQEYPGFETEISEQSVPWRTPENEKFPEASAVAVRPAHQATWAPEAPAPKEPETAYATGRHAGAAKSELKAYEGAEAQEAEPEEDSVPSVPEAQEKAKDAESSPSAGEVPKECVPVDVAEAPFGTVSATGRT